MERVILHCDANAFYASVECLYTPSIRHLPWRYAAAWRNAMASC